jgi:hypothetical protein
MMDCTKMSNICTVKRLLLIAYVDKGYERIIHVKQKGLHGLCEHLCFISAVQELLTI